MKRAVETPAAPRPVGAYSQAIVSDGLVFVSGQASVSAATEQIEPGSIEEETRRTIDNIEAILAAAGATLGDVVKATVHLAKLQDFAEFDAAFRERFPEPLPARTTVQSGLPSILVEIDVIARVSSTSRR